MRYHFPVKRGAALILTLILALAAPLSVSADFFRWEPDPPCVLDFAKNGPVGSVLVFTPEDFVSSPADAKLGGITLNTLPDPEAGVLVIGDRSLRPGAVLDRTALAGLRFRSAPSPAPVTTSFTFTPNFSDGPGRRESTVTLYLLDQENHPPIARNMELSTYRNVAITGYLDASDNEGDPLTFRLTSDPARGSLTLAEDGSGKFVYTPYENKTGRDSFTFVAVDDAGNTSPEAKVRLRISKPDTKVTYADLEGHSAHKAAIRLAERGIYVGRCVNGHYFFSPGQPVSRAQFLTMAMAAAGAEPLDGVTLTGFHDDEAIPTWARGSVSAALKAGAIRGSRDENGAPVFGPGESITRGEADVMLNRLLGVSDVPVEVFSPGSSSHWAAQAAANLTASGIVRSEETGAVSLSDVLTLGDAAQLLDRALDVLDTRSHSAWLSW